MPVRSNRSGASKAYTTYAIIDVAITAAALAHSDLSLRSHAHRNETPAHTAYSGAHTRISGCIANSGTPANR